MSLNAIAISLCGMLLCGCAGNHFNWNEARRAQVGMTETEVQNTMGKPTQIIARQTA